MEEQELLNIHNLHLTEPVTTAPWNGGHHIKIPKQEVDQMFEKKFQYQKPVNDQWHLASPNELFKEFYQLDDLQEMKRHLNEVKSKLNNYGIEDWSSHTRRKDPAGEIPWYLKTEVKAEFVTVAWCKFFECLNSFPLVHGPQLNTLHLCEAPGAFITALNHYLYSRYDSEQVQWQWLSTTLNPYYEGNPLGKMIIDDRFMLYTLDRWLFHDDFTGNIISQRNIESIREQCATRLNGEVHLVTADGSIDCVEVPDKQEDIVYTLHFAEMIIALNVLTEGGSFVIKKFTLFESTSVSIMYFLNCIFDEVHVYKPATSRRGNSEVYVICLGYRRNTPHLRETLEILMTLNLDKYCNVLPMFAKSQLPDEFLRQHRTCAGLFMCLQVNAIESNIYTYEYNCRNDARRGHLLRSMVCQEYCSRYRVHSIPDQMKILYDCQGQIQAGTKYFVYKGSYTERELLKTTTLEEKIFMLRGNLNEFEKTFNSRYGILLLEDQTSSSGRLGQLRLYSGAEYEKLNTSLFATVHLLLLRLKLQEIFNVDPIWQIQSKCIINQDIVLPFNDIPQSFSRKQYGFFLSILNAIIMQGPQEVSFKNFPFLTHFSVSLLRYLALNVFDQFSIASEPDFIITLRQRSTATSDPKIQEKYEAIRTLRDALEGQSNALCVMDIMQLHRNAFSQAISDYNNLLLLKNFKTLLLPSN